MTTWPTNMTIEPIGAWPGSLALRRKPSQFSASLGDTLDVLKRELRMLAATNVRLQVAVPPEQFRLDGRPRSNAVATHPGVILTLESKHGALSYPCDTFTTWPDNLRAIALALDALRRVDRYGVTQGGEQYRGFLAIEATASRAEFATADDALAFVCEFLGDAAGAVTLTSRDALASAVRAAKRDTHPDLGGDPAAFHRVSLAEAKLREAGLL